MTARSLWCSMAAGAALVGGLSLAPLGLACGTKPALPCVGPGDTVAFSLDVVVTDESGAAVSGANVDLGAGAPVTTGGDGHAHVSANAAALAIVSAPGFLSEPVPLGVANDGASVAVTLLSSKNGARFVVHSGGDVMFGRRYEAPTDGSQPLIPQNDPANGAKAVVAQLARLYRVSDVRTMNLETVVTDRDDSASYPGKKYVLRTRPGALAAVKSLDTTVVSLANNHSRDFLDDGINDTLSALGGQQISFVGATPDANPGTPFTTTVAGTKIAELAYTSIDGTIDNINYAKEGDPAPATQSPQDAFQYQDRSWGFQGQMLNVPVAQRRIGAAWPLFATPETMGLSASDETAGWASISKVYPELQDWCARRGHGGAQIWDSKVSAAAIASAKANNDLVIVQIHAGIQFVEAPAASAEQTARDAIDAGADLVVMHHPHVLQGITMYKGKIIAHSLGNFVFDQDFFTTFGSVMLRTVWEKSTLVQARIIPLELVSYIPAATSGRVAQRDLFRVWERSVIGAGSSYASNGNVYGFTETLPQGEAPAHLILEHGTGRVVADAPPTATKKLTVPAGQSVALDTNGLVDPRLGLSGGANVQIGRDLFGWGSFEPEFTGSGPTGTHWQAATCDKGATLGDAANGHGFMRLQRVQSNTGAVEVRQISLVPVARHRFYDGANQGSPAALDPNATYSVRFNARLAGTAKVEARFDLYSFEDLNPTEDPTSTLVTQITAPISLTGNIWQPVELKIPEDKLGSASVANEVFVYFRLYPPDNDTATFDIDDVAIVEWRPAAQMVGRFGMYDFVRNDGSADVTLNIPFLPATR